MKRSGFGPRHNAIDTDTIILVLFVIKIILVVVESIIYIALLRGDGVIIQDCVLLL